MGRNGIDHEGDKCPRLFRIPRPVVAPRHIGPNGADEDAVAKECECRIKHGAHKDGDEQQQISHDDSRHVDGQQPRVEHRQRMVGRRILTQEVVEQEGVNEQEENGQQLVATPSQFG